MNINAREPIYTTSLWFNLRAIVAFVVNVQKFVQRRKKHPIGEYQLASRIVEVQHIQPRLRRAQKTEHESLLTYLTHFSMCQEI